MRKARKKVKGRVEFYHDTQGEFRWRVFAANGRILADSGESYKRWNGVIRGMKHAAKIMQEYRGIKAAAKQ